MAKFEAKDPRLVSYREHVTAAINDIAPETFLMKSAKHKFTDHTRKSMDRGHNVKACVDSWLNRYRAKPADITDTASVWGVDEVIKDIIVKDTAAQFAKEDAQPTPTPAPAPDTPYNFEPLEKPTGQISDKPAGASGTVATPSSPEGGAVMGGNVRNVWGPAIGKSDKKNNDDESDGA